MMHLFKISKEANRVNLLEIINVFLLLSLSGINFFSDNDNFLLAVTLLNMFVFFFKKEKVDNGYLAFFIFFVLLSVAQVIWFQDGSFKSVMGFILRLLTAYLVIKNCKDFVSSYLRLLLFLAAAGIFFYVFFLLFPSIEEMLFVNKHFWDNPATYEFKKSLIIFNIFREPLYGTQTAPGLFGLPRNSGPFWEPGAFGGFLILGIVFEMILFRKFSFRVLIYVLALITTFSTTGYVALAVFFLLYFLFLETNQKRKILILPALLVGGFFLAVDVDFIADKIMGQIQGFKQTQTYAQSDDDTRLGSTRLDFYDFQRSPLVGTGPSDETRFGRNEALFMRTNGITDLLVKVGLLGFVFVSGFFYRSLRKYFTINETSKPEVSARIFIFITFLISLSETYFNMPFFWSLFLLQYAERIPPIDTYEIVDI